MIAIVAAMLMLTSAQPALPAAQLECSGASYRQALSWWKEGEVAFKGRHWVAANRLYDRGLVRLGTSYVQPPRWPDDTMPIDDSGQHLLFTKDMVREGKYREAASERGRILSNRLRLYRYGRRCR